MIWLTDHHDAIPSITTHSCKVDTSHSMTMSLEGMDQEQKVSQSVS